VVLGYAIPLGKPKSCDDGQPGHADFAANLGPFRDRGGYAVRIDYQQSLPGLSFPKFLNSIKLPVLLVK
jgi:hypothetical protein